MEISTRKARRKLEGYDKGSKKINKKTNYKNPKFKTKIKRSFLDDVWTDAINIATNETKGTISFPVNCPWAIEQILDDEFFPS